MKLKAAIERIPGGLMLVPLLLGATLNTLDQAHFGWIESALQALGAAPAKNGHYELLRIGAVAAGSPNAAAYREITGIATAQISIAVISTALLCPVAVMLAARWQRARGIDGTAEETRS